MSKFLKNGIIEFQNKAYLAKDIIYEEKQGMFTIIKIVDFYEIRDNENFHKKFIGDSIKILES